MTNLKILMVTILILLATLSDRRQEEEYKQEEEEEEEEEGSSEARDAPTPILNPASCPTLASSDVDSWQLFATSPPPQSNLAFAHFLAPSVI